MHRASAARPALLMATATAALLVARVHSLSPSPSSSPSPLEAVNPWLSACDLVQPAATDDLQGACSVALGMPLALAAAPGPPSGDACPPPCAAAAATTTRTAATTTTTTNNNNNTTINQCLYYLEESHKDALCDGGDRDQRLRHIHQLRLRHCCEHAVAATLRPRARQAVLAGGAQCKHHLEALLEVDALAARISCEFTEVLTRYDCGQPYSIVYHCDDCKEAYRRWVCSSLVPHLTDTGGRVRPCRSVCQTVEQRCPYMLPGDRAPAHPTQYAGEPTFLCLDPNIPETGMQKEKSSHGEDECCYTYCGTPGRPCARCAAGASNATWAPVACAALAAGAARGPSCRPASGAPSAAAPTIPPPQTLLLCRWTWTTSWTLLIHVLTQHAPMLGTLITNILHCSLLMCVQCARTPLALVKTKWKSRSS